MEEKNTLSLRYIAKNIFIVLGLVLIWRGIWYGLDALDHFLFGGIRLWSALFGTVLGFLVLYLPDRDLKEITRL